MRQHIVDGHMHREDLRVPYSAMTERRSIWDQTVLELE
nr:hypothetical protein [Tanacetum cinerariifolium]